MITLLTLGLVERRIKLMYYVDLVEATKNSTSLTKVKVRHKQGVIPKPNLGL